VVFDALTWNSDQKPEHVLVSPRTSGSWPVWTIDRGNTFTTTNTLSQLDPSTPIPQPMALLQPGLQMARAEPWIRSAESISRTEFQAMVRGLPAPWIIEPDAPEMLADALVQRVKNLRGLLSNHLQ